MMFFYLINFIYMSIFTIILLDKKYSNNKVIKYN
jgi:hypothetical protein